MPVNLFSKATIVGVALVVAQASSAATLDFAAEADGINGERGVLDGTTLVNMQGSGLDVTLSAPSGFAYLDAGDAGLGVCQTLDASAQCDPSSDDNVTLRETVYMTVADTITGAAYGNLNTGLFRDKGHRLFNGKLDYSVDGGLSWLLATVVGGTYDFGHVDFSVAGLGFKYHDETHADNQFYVSSLDVQPVPVPAAGFLLLGGLGALGAMRRRRRHA